MRLLILSLVSLGLNAETVKLTVQVIDAVTLAGISGAQVRMIQTAPPDGRSVGPEYHTDGGGFVRIDAPAHARLRVTEIDAAGYAGITASALIVTGAEPLAVTYSLTRTGSMSGRIVDSDSGDPVAGVGVESLLASWVRGRREMQRGLKSAITQKDGTFVLQDLREGDYALDLNSYSADGKHVPVSGYSQVVWPGGGDFSSALPVRLSYGADLRLGEIRVRKGELSKLTVNVTGGQCAHGQAYEVTLGQFSFSSSFTRGFQRAACSSATTFEEVTPGEYEVQVSAPWQKDDERQLGAVPILVEKGAGKVTVEIGAPVLLRGRLTADQDADLPTGLQVHLWARGSKLTGFSHLRSFLFRADADGTFTGRSYVPAGGEIQVDVSPLPPNYYVRALGYDGLSWPGNMFVIHAGGPWQRLDIAVSDRAATLNGSVRTRDGAVAPDAKVLLTRWPADVVSEYPFGVEEATAGDSGTYFFAHLRPGTYRAIAVPAAVRPKLEEPGVMLALFASAESFDVAESASSVRQLTPVAPR